ncbi:MAG TPA: hypothetical protein VEC16_02135 [Alphaproteobacteria bacterium]|nr:hypothetical protein [Alphaproteobacteria bacterium]
MGIVQRHIRSAAFADYRLLKNYAIYREDCYDDNSKLVKILFDEELRDKYATIYENKLGVDIHPCPKDAEKIVKERLEDAFFASTRYDGIVFYLLYASNVIELGMTVKAYKENNPKLRLISYINEDKMLRNYIEGNIGADKCTETMLREMLSIKKESGLRLNKTEFKFAKPIPY